MNELSARGRKRQVHNHTEHREAAVSSAKPTLRRSPHQSHGLQAQINAATLTEAAVTLNALQSTNPTGVSDRCHISQE